MADTVCTLATPPLPGRALLIPHETMGGCTRLGREGRGAGGNAVQRCLHWHAGMGP